MSKVLMFSRVFPIYHIREGEPTNFVEKLRNTFENKGLILALNPKINGSQLFKFINQLDTDESGIKAHTIRRGKRFKKGDVFSPRAWSDIPYASKQVIIAPDQIVTNTWDFEITEDGKYLINGKESNYIQLNKIALNDGFESLDDFELWFNLKIKEPFKGQIICWDNKISY